MELKTVMDAAEKAAASSKQEPRSAPFSWDEVKFRRYGVLTEVIPGGLVCRARNRCGKLFEWECPEPILLFEGGETVGRSGSKYWALTFTEDTLQPLRHPHVFPGDGSICMGSAEDPITALIQLDPNSPAGLRLDYVYDKGGPEGACRNCPNCTVCSVHDKKHLENKHIHHIIHKVCGKCRSCKECECKMCPCPVCPSVAPCTTCTEVYWCKECGACLYHLWHRPSCKVPHESCNSGEYTVCEHEQCSGCCGICYEGEEDDEDSEGYHEHCATCDACSEDTSFCTSCDHCDRHCDC